MWSPFGTGLFSGWTRTSNASGEVACAGDSTQASQINRQGDVVEGPGFNILCVRGGVVITPDEVFISTSGGGVLAVTRVDGKEVGPGSVGNITRQLAGVYWEWHKDPAFSSPINFDQA